LLLFPALSSPKRRRNGSNGREGTERKEWKERNGEKAKTGHTERIGCDEAEESKGTRRDRM
jgi:hypothetical protein